MLALAGQANARLLLCLLDTRNCLLDTRSLRDAASNKQDVRSLMIRPRHTDPESDPESEPIKETELLRTISRLTSMALSK